MAAVALNTFRTVRHVVSTDNVIVYTCPIGVAAIVLYGTAAYDAAIPGAYTETFSHCRPDAPIPDFPIIKDGPVIIDNALNLLTGRLVLETNDELKIQGNTTGDVKVVISILETAKS